MPDSVMSPRFERILTHLREDRPEYGPLLLGQTRLAAKPRDIAVVLPSLELPRVDHPIPLGPEERRAELVPLDKPRGLVQQLPYLVCGRQRRCADIGFIEPSARCDSSSALRGVRRAWARC